MKNKCQFKTDEHTIRNIEKKRNNSKTRNIRYIFNMTL